MPAQYHIIWRGQKTGPFVEEELLQKIERGELSQFYQLHDGKTVQLVRDWLDTRSRAESEARRQEEAMSAHQETQQREIAEAQQQLLEAQQKLQEERHLLEVEKASREAVANAAAALPPLPADVQPGMWQQTAPQHFYIHSGAQSSSSSSQVSEGMVPYSFNFWETLFTKYAAFSGRASRKEYWLFTLCHLSIIFFGAFLTVLAVMNKETEIFGIIFMVFTGLFILVAFIPFLALSIRRLHDSDHSGAWVLINFIPYIGDFIFLIFTLLDSTHGRNRYGEDPRWRFPDGRPVL